MFDRFVASETTLNDALQTLRVDVYITYQGSSRKAYSYIVPMNQEEYEDPEYML